ncbi:MAG: Gfo/Idh/MocA family oxidoreductase [Candidatus Lindowbacteria bacterium]|nr:Gfo/Idh/MocA family oxidoreductase [Candidatus Lindowbacteria bacterium]
MPRLRVGLVGAGFIGVAHANAIETIISEQLVAADFVSICDTDAERACGIAESFGAKEHCGDAIELINSGKIDTVFICTPTKSHPELVAAAAKRGLNIFCEKPLARTLSEAREMRLTVERAGVRNQVGLVLRFSPVYNVIRQLLSDPSLGRPMAVIFRDDQYFPIQGIYGSTWRGDVDVSGGGALIEHSIHDVDILRWLFGEIAGVQSKIKNFAGHRDVEDMVAAQFDFERGCVGQLASVWHNVLRRESNRYMEIFCENGYISSADDFIGPVTYQKADEDACVIPAEQVLQRYLAAAGLQDAKYGSLHSMQGLQDYHFLHALEKGIAPAPDFSVAVKAHEIVETIYSSDPGKK